MGVCPREAPEGPARLHLDSFFEKWQKRFKSLCTYSEVSEPWPLLEPLVSAEPGTCGWLAPCPQAGLLLIIPQSDCGEMVSSGTDGPLCWASLAWWTEAWPVLWGVPGWGSVPGQGYSCPVQEPNLQLPCTECPSQPCSAHLSLPGTELHPLGCLAMASLQIPRLGLTLLAWGSP